MPKKNPARFFKFTKRNVEAVIREAVADEKRIYRHDTEVKGLGLQAEPTGTASYFYEYRIGGRAGQNRRFNFLRHSAITTPERARKELEALKQQVRNGIDPKAARDAKVREHTAGTVQAACERYLDTQGGGKRTWHETKRLFKVDVFPVIGATPLPKLIRRDVRALLDAKAVKAPVFTRRVFNDLRVFLKWCVESELILVNPMDGLTPPPPPPARDRFLNDDEITAFWEETGIMGWPFGPAFRLLILTGQRLREVCEMRWNEIDFDARVWTIPGTRAPVGKVKKAGGTKNKLTHYVALSKPALAILHEMSAIRRPGAVFVFTTTDHTPISGYSKAKARLVARMTVALGGPFPHMCLHDMRRTCATGLQRLGYPLEVTERLINHSTGKTTGGVAGIYQRHDFAEQRRIALDEWAAHIEALAASGRREAPRGVSSRDAE